jgi:hypothetical protein
MRTMGPVVTFRAWFINSHTKPLNSIFLVIVGSRDFLARVSRHDAMRLERSFACDPDPLCKGRGIVPDPGAKALVRPRLRGSHRTIDPGRRVTAGRQVKRWRGTAVGRHGAAPVKYPAPQSDALVSNRSRSPQILPKKRDFCSRSTSRRGIERVVTS